MNGRKLLCLISTLATVLSAAQSPGQGDPSTLDRIVDAGKNHSRVVELVRHLSLDIGARLTGSLELAVADAWAIREFKACGCENAHLEQWGSVPAGFDRGPIQVCRMVEPERREMEFTTPAWTNGTAGLERGEAIALPGTLEAVRMKSAKWKGKWLVAPPGFGAVSPSLERELERCGAYGIISGSRNELVITSGPNWRSVTFARHPGLPHVIVRKSDYDEIKQRLLDVRRVVLEINAENRWFPGPVPCYTVIADIRGTGKPDEMVIVSGHLDSWNGPGSQGAQDNGVGASEAIEAARILCLANARPKRTIRFILWSGEEQGTLGSISYVRTHSTELDRISAVLVGDAGGNYQAGFRILPSMNPMMAEAIRKSVESFPDMPQSLEQYEAPRLRGGASDEAPFNAAGVPGLFALATGPLDYTYVHHTQHDRFETVVSKYLVQSATNEALVAYNLACADTLLPRR